MPEAPLSPSCAECGERRFAEQLQVFLGKCQAFVGAASFSSDTDADGALESTVRALPVATTPAHYKLLKALIKEFVDGCARGAPEYERLDTDDWSDRAGLAETFRRACETALLERAWSRRASSPQVHRALAETRRRATEPGFNGAEAARACGISAAYLLRLCRAELGVSFSQVLRHHRTSLARRRLTTTGESIKEVAARVGYNSCSAFIRDFKRECRVTPGEFRRWMRTRELRSRS